MTKLAIKIVGQRDKKLVGLNYSYNYLKINSAVRNLTKIDTIKLFL